MKRCEDCRWCRGCRCGHPASMECGGRGCMCLCSGMRIMDRMCSAEARYYEATLWRRILAWMLGEEP